MIRAAITIVTLGTAVVASAGPVDHRCGTPELLTTRAIPRLAPASAIPARAAAGPKQTRDAFGATFQKLETANFAVKWSDASITMGQAQLVADALEAGWATFVDRLRHAPCTGCDTFRLNAYIASETTTPSIDFAGGYAWIDDQGFPYFVISRDMFGQASADTIAAIVAHELHHDFQFSTGAYAYETTRYTWFWEASAEWAAAEVLPESPEPYLFSGAFALRSELPVYYWGDPFGADEVAGVHQYGAAIFLRHVTDKLAAPGIVVNAWETATADAEPLAEMARQMPESDLAALHTEFAARNALWDYPYGPRIVDSIQLFKSAFPELDEIAARVPPEGQPLTHLERSPSSFGYSTLELARPTTGHVEIEVVMQPEMASALHATVVYGAPGSATYVPLAVEGDVASGTVELPAGVDRAYLVVSATSDERVLATPIPVAVRVAPHDPAAVDESAGCQAAAQPGWLALLGLALLRRRCRR